MQEKGIGTTTLEDLLPHERQEPWGRKSEDRTANAPPVVDREEPDPLRLEGPSLSRGTATQTRSAASWYAIACRSASAHRCIFISIAVTLVPREPTRSARRPRIGTSIRTSNPASRSQVATGSRRSASKRKATSPEM